MFFLRNSTMLSNDLSSSLNNTGYYFLPLGYKYNVGYALITKLSTSFKLESILVNNKLS